MECQVRPATGGDTAAISRVVIAALRESNSQDYSPDVIAQVERSFAPEAVSALLDKRKVFVALLGEIIIGTASLDRDVVRSVFVDPAYQGGGIGRQLMDVIMLLLLALVLELCGCRRRLRRRSFTLRWVIRKFATSFMGLSAPSLWKNGLRVSSGFSPIYAAAIQ